MSNLDKSDAVPHFAPNRCGFAHAAEILGDKWVLTILRQLFYGVARFEDIRADTGVPKSVLSQKLSRLMQQGLVIKRPYKAQGARTRWEYHLSAQGIDLAKSFLALLEWGNRHLPISGAPIVPAHRRSGEELRLVLVDKAGVEVSLQDTTLAEASDGA